MYENAVCAVDLSLFFWLQRLRRLICTNIRSIHVIQGFHLLYRCIAKISAKTTPTFSLIHNYTLKVEHRQKNLLQFQLDIILCT